MRRWGLALAAAAALILAVPASATHSPNGENRLVTMTVSRSGLELTFKYTIDQQPCPNPHCAANYGKAYEIKIYVDDGATDTNGLAQWSHPIFVSGPPRCTASAAPVVTCNAGSRNQDDPSAAYPLTAEIKVLAGTKEGAKAEIDVAGYSLNNYAEGISVPAYDCGSEENNYRQAQRLFDTRREAYFRRLDYYNDHYAGTRFVARLLFLDSR